MLNNKQSALREHIPGPTAVLLSPQRTVENTRNVCPEDLKEGVDNLGERNHEDKARKSKSLVEINHARKKQLPQKTFVTKTREAGLIIQPPIFKGMCVT